MAQKVSADGFVQFLQKQVEEKAGYIMGSSGQDPKKWLKDSWWFTQYKGSQLDKALYWREHANRVFDCNGLAEGYYKDVTGVDINTRARYNYANWCGVKGTGFIPVKYRVPGAAVFWGANAANITHVAYLEKPVEDASGDWYIIEARGVMYGVIRSRLYSRKPGYWGLMNNYFDYGTGGEENGEKTPVQPVNEGACNVTVPTLRKGSKSGYVETLQLLLNGKNEAGLEADGEFGNKTDSAVRSFQQKNGLNVDGVVGVKTWTQLLQ